MTRTSTLPYPRAKALYLVALATLSFLLPQPWAPAALAGSQLALALLAGVPSTQLWGAARRLGWFFFFLALVLVLLPPRDATGLVTLPLVGWSAWPPGLVEAGQMALRLLTVVWSAAAVRAVSAPSELAAGLRGLGLPPLAALSVDLTLGLMDEVPGQAGRGDGTGGGKGDGTGGGRGGEGRLTRLGRYLDTVRQGDARMVEEPLRAAMSRARARAEREHPSADRELLNDAVVIAALSSILLSMKLIRTLPGLPFAPGHKNAVMMPLYILAGELTQSRWGSTICGLCTGFMAFLMGDGRYGVFEVLKHLVPGVLVDTLHPLVRGLGLRVWVYAGFGLVLAAGRFAADVLVALLLGAPGAFWAYVGGAALTHLAAGALSGFVTVPALRVVEGGRQRWLAAEPPPPGPTSPPPGGHGSGQGRGQGGGAGLVGLMMGGEGVGDGQGAAGPAWAQGAELGQGDDLVVGDGRLHLNTGLMGESLIRTALIQSTDVEEEVATLPDVRVVGLGGRSIMDRGRAALLPLLDEIVALRRELPLILGVSGGARLRHVYHVALDLGIPTGGLAQLAGACEEQNIVMLQTLLARHNAVFIQRDHFLDLPLYLNTGVLPLVTCMPPYHYWEPPAKGASRIPENGPDMGLVMTAEALGASVCVLIKDQDGLYTDDPATHPEAQLIPRISAQELIDRQLPSLILEREAVNVLRHARFVREVHILNGLVPSRLSAALRGQPVLGTIITRE